MDQVIVRTRPPQYPGRVKIVEVGPRDGLQNESTRIPTNIKIELIERLGDSGLTAIEAASFVSPKWVPQMADSREVMDGIERQNSVVYSALTPNMQGFDAAIAAGADEVVIFGAASEAYSMRNINCSIEESIARFSPVARAAKDAGVRLRASVSCALGCPYQGFVSTEDVSTVVRRFADLGCDEIDIADTIGVGTPVHVKCWPRPRHFRPKGWPDIFTIRTARRLPMSLPAWKSGFRHFTPPYPAWEDARMRQAQPAISRQRIWSIC